MNNYRVTVEGQQGPVLNAYPGEQWARVADACEERGLTARLERRLVTDTGILELIEDTTGYIQLGARVLCPWETIAEMGAERDRRHP